MHTFLFNSVAQMGIICLNLTIKLRQDSFLISSDPRKLEINLCFRIIGSLCKQTEVKERYENCSLELKDFGSS